MIPLVLTFHPFNYKARDVISRNFQILKNDPDTSAISTENPLISFRRNKNIRDNLVRSALRQNLRHQRVPFLALVLFVTRVRSSTLPHPFPDLNPNAPPPTSFTAFFALTVANFTSVKWIDVYLTDLLNTLIP